MSFPTEYDVALSFAGEDRPYVSQVAIRLKSHGVRVFYDEFQTAELWGKDLYQHLAEIYQNKAKYCVVFISQSYAEKHWTKHELKNIQARQFRVNTEYLLPARFDHTFIPGMPDTMAYIDIANMSPIDFSDIILAKIMAAIEPSPKNIASSQELIEKIGDKDIGARFLEQELKLLMKKIESVDVLPSIVFFDIDDLTVINRLYGGTVGSSVLSAIYDIGNSTRLAKVKYFGRCGDDTFYSVLFDSFRVAEFCEKLKQNINLYNWQIINPRLKVTCTIGHATLLNTGYLYQWIYKAITAMVEGKFKGKNTIYSGDFIASKVFQDDVRFFVKINKNKPLRPFEIEHMHSLVHKHYDHYDRKLRKKRFSNEILYVYLCELEETQYFDAIRANDPVFIAEQQELFRLRSFGCS